MTQRVAVTGIGAISAFGHTFPDLWSGLAAGRSAIRPLTLVAPGTLRFPNAAEVPDYDPVHYFEEKEAQLLDRIRHTMPQVDLAGNEIQPSGLNPRTIQQGLDHPDQSV